MKILDFETTISKSLFEDSPMQKEIIGVVITFTFFIIFIIFKIYLYFQEKRLDKKWEQDNPRSSFPYCGKTLLFYDPSHGNQVEYLDTKGRCYLWYPGNPIILKGRWRANKDKIYFRYGSNTFNPVLNKAGGGWEGQHIIFWSTSIVDIKDGDPLKLKSTYFTHSLKKHPQFPSLDNIF